MHVYGEESAAYIIASRDFPACTDFPVYGEESAAYIIASRLP